MARAKGRRDDDAPLGTENAAMREDEVISGIGDTEAMKAAIAIERRDDPESGGVQEQQEYLRWERKMDEEEAKPGGEG